MIQAKSLKSGTTFKIDEKPYRVLKYFHQKIGRGGATVRVTVKNLLTGNQEEKTFSSDHKVDEINTTKKPLQFLYKRGSSITFMDPKTYEQTEIPVKIISDVIKFMKEGDTLDVLLWEEKPLHLEIPDKVSLEVAETDPGVRGNSATNIYKPAVLENGLKIKVPLFIKKGEVVIVDTRTEEYVGRER